ncbi:polyisoprenoid diphosphate/phosphate phosphohydrolase PLPP6-like [Liolophura sinensis]|uniref:polyisoprenoid diphosphate/phosphate phosphohydrolase PLPP6-like n=1 Tax=Liolophura sinensis TaxID=3198878 RepID=UPI003158F3E4
MAEGDKTKSCLKEDDEMVDIMYSGKTLWNKILRLDEECTKKLSFCAMLDSSFGRLRPFMKLLEISCHGIPWYLCTIAGLMMAYRPENIEVLMNLLIGLFLDITVVGLTKVIVRRARPAHNQMDMFATISVDNYSFPSGHASRAAMLLLFFVKKVFSPGSMWCYLMWVWSVSVSVSRVILGRHHILDVVAGFLIGICQYYVLLQFWLPASLCISILEPYLGHFHL